MEEEVRNPLLVFESKFDAMKNIVRKMRSKNRGTMPKLKGSKKLTTKAIEAISKMVIIRNKILFSFFFFSSFRLFFITTY
jgi:hypothetical protein